jgi:hypothetical protein
MTRLEDANFGQQWVSSSGRVKKWWIRCSITARIAKIQTMLRKKAARKLFESLFFEYTHKLT